MTLTGLFLVKEKVKVKILVKVELYLKNYVTKSVIKLCYKKQQK